MKRRIVGIALDGRHDLAATDRDEDGGSDIRVVSGGTCADVITTLDNRLIAGPQAILAPHGRGQGWGAIGASKLRRALAQAIDAPEKIDNARDLSAAMDALARGAQEVILSVPDLAAFDEARQGALIKACRGTKRRNVRLLWRSVAAMLDLIHQKRVGADDIGQRVRLLIHSAFGIEEQFLMLREDMYHPGHLAPQRDGPGSLSAHELGLDAIFARAQEFVQSCSPINWDRCEPSHLGALLAVGSRTPGQTEVLRHQNGGWRVVKAPELPTEVIVQAMPMIVPPEMQVGMTILVTPLAPNFAQALAAAIGENVEVMHTEIIARGCLQAGRLIEKGLPHYFDRLEAISIAALRDGEPAFVPLIPDGHLVAANREYVSEDLTDFVWPKGRVETDFFILKGQSEVRHWTVQKVSGPDRDMALALRIRQTPGQSWALLDINAPQWDVLARAPERLDWQELSPLEETPEEVLENLRRPPPTIPDRLIEPAHRDLWLGNTIWAGNGEPATLARHVAAGGAIQTADWAPLLRAGRINPIDGLTYRLINSDGELPDGLPQDVCSGFELMLRETCIRLTSNAQHADNTALMSVTWCFAACPEPVQDDLLDALDAHELGNVHRLLRPPRAITVVRQGAGRALTGEGRLARLFTMIDRTPLNNDTINALAMAIARRIEAPRALTRAQVESLIERLGNELLHQVQSNTFQVKFKNTLSAIAGLFRWREIEPYALLAENEPNARHLKKTLTAAANLLGQSQYQRVPRRDFKVELIQSILEYLEGRGDPSILRKIEDG
ncbi:hypothetical protein [Roseinatronobacter sp.]|uniref:hypothetical protein n=1 Tax=Roseinatronobacter sp. TaxID=1945755 RepID=UPI0025E72524|nr:hypothetical protein [Roseibaca sp.]